MHVEQELSKVIEMIKTSLESLNKELKIVENYLGEVGLYASNYKVENHQVAETNDDVDFGIIHHSNKTKIFIEMIEIIKEITIHLQVTIVLFTIDKLHIQKGIIEQGKLISNGQVQDVNVKIPHFIYNYVLHTKPSSIAKMRELRVQNQTTIVNPINRFDHDVIYDICRSVSNFKQYVLPLFPFTTQSLKKMAENHNHFYLLPLRTQLTDRAIRVEKTMSGESIFYTVVNGQSKLPVREQHLYYQIKKMIRNSKYVIVGSISPLFWDKTPLEIRTYLQKGKTGQWGALHTIAKKQIFSKDSFLDMQTGSASEILKQLVPSKVDSIMTKINTNATELATLLDYFMSDLGSCFIDYMVNTEGDLYILRVGGIEQNELLFALDNRDYFRQYIENTIEHLHGLKNSINKV